MRLRLPLALAALLALTPLAAHADGISDFLLTGDGHTITFSLPTTYLAANMGRPYDPAYIATGTATVDGVSGFSISPTFYAAQLISSLGRIGFNPSFSGISALDLNGSTKFAAYGPTTDPNAYVAVNLVPGTYQLFVLEDNSSGGQIGSYVMYNLTITPEAATPEPSTLVDATTGLLSLSLLAVYKRRAHSFFSI